MSFQEVDNNALLLIANSGTLITETNNGKEEFLNMFKQNSNATVKFLKMT